MSRPTPRRPASSRGTTPRPRKIAGQASTRPDDVDETVETVDPVEDTAPVIEPAPTRRRVSLRKPTAPAVEPDADNEPDGAEDGADDGAGILARPGTTRGLVIALVIVSVLLFVQALAFVILKVTEEDPPPTAQDTSGAVAVPAGRPVVAAELSVVEGVDAAAKAAQEIVAVDYQKYDDEVDAAAELMTDRFEEQYRTTAGDIQEQFIAQKTVVQANVVAQGVVRANRTRLQALVFLNQVVTRTRDGKPESVVTPFKVLVTVVHTDQGWLVDGLDTDQPQDKTK